MATLTRNRLALAAGLVILGNGWITAQTLQPRPPAGQESKKEEAVPSPPAPVPVAMSVPAGTPIKVALDSEVQVRKVGQPIHGKTVEPVYAFDKLLIPVGTTVTGKVSAIDSVSKKTRTLDALDVEFCRLGTVG